MVYLTDQKAKKKRSLLRFTYIKVNLYENVAIKVHYMQIIS